MGARALVDTCCQPYWNELSRAQRGSRPRIYFEGNNVDNDASQGLLHLLGAETQRVAQNVDDRWGLVSSARAVVRSRQPPPFGSFLRRSKQVVVVTEPRWPSSPFPSPGMGENSISLRKNLAVLRSSSAPMAWWEVLRSFRRSDWSLRLSLGINVIELLTGAVEMTRHFRDAAPEENIVLQVCGQSSC